MVRNNFVLICLCGLLKKHNQCSPIHEQLSLLSGSFSELILLLIYKQIILSCSFNEVKMNEWQSVNKY